MRLDRIGRPLGHPKKGSAAPGGLYGAIPAGVFPSAALGIFHGKAAELLVSRISISIAVFHRGAAKRKAGRAVCRITDQGKTKTK